MPRPPLLSLAAAAAALAIAVLLASNQPALAAKDDQVGNGKKVPEVPLAALLPGAGALAGGGYYLLARIRGARRRNDSDASRDER